MFSYACQSFYTTKDEIPNLDGVEVDGAVMELCDAEFVECLPKKCITSNRGNEVKSFPSAALLSSCWNVVR